MLFSSKAQRDDADASQLQSSRDAGDAGVPIGDKLVKRGNLSLSDSREDDEDASAKLRCVVVPTLQPADAAATEVPGNTSDLPFRNDMGCQFMMRTVHVQ